MRNSDLGAADRVARLVAILIEQADAEIERTGLLDAPFTRTSDPSPHDWPIRKAYNASLVQDWLRRETLSIAPAFNYGPFRNGTKAVAPALAPSAQRRQRIARRIERAHRK